VLKKIDVVKKQRKPGRIDVVNARVLYCGLGLIKLVDPLITVGEITELLPLFELIFQASSAAAWAFS